MLPLHLSPCFKPLACLFVAKRLRLSPATFAWHFLVIFSIGFTAIFGLIMRAFEIAYLVSCSSVCPCVCLPVLPSPRLSGSPHAASSPRLHLASTFIDLLAWNMWKNKHKRASLPPPLPAWQLPKKKIPRNTKNWKPIETISLFIVSRPRGCQFVPASLSPQSFVLTAHNVLQLSRVWLCFWLDFSVCLVLATAHRKLPVPLPHPTFHLHPLPPQTRS